MKVLIRKFKRLENLTVNVPAEISGANGSGKSTILEAISFVLTGKDLQGSTFSQIYDNRQPLSEAIADVSFYDSYGNEYRRTVEPTFQTSRSGEESVKILRSTRCTKNKIDVNDFANEFEDFYKYGTDYFFNQHPDVQRSEFISLMKSLLPNYDVKTAQLELKQLQKTQRETKNEITILRKELKGITDVELVSIPDELKKQEAEYQSLINSSVDNQKQVAEINKRNNEAITKYRDEKEAITDAIYDNERKLKDVQYQIEQLTAKLEGAKATSFVGVEQIPTEEIKAEIDALNGQLSKLTYYDNLNEYAKNHGRNNPIVAQNMERMKKLKYATPENLPECETLSAVCSACGVESQQCLDNGIENIISGLKAENKQILEREMRSANAKYISVKDDRDRAVARLNHIEAKNKKTVEESESLKRSFDIKKTKEVEEIEKKIFKLNTDEEYIKNVLLIDLNDSLKSLKQPTPEQLPTELTISDELKEAHQNYVKLHEEIIGAKAINKNNAEKKASKEIEVTEKRDLLMEVDEKIITLQSEITDYFSNLNSVVEKEFKGKIKIGVKLQEWVMAREEYKDVFLITANDKVFPYECNGALINNVKLQVLATLQRLKGYKGITILDNAEANTTQPIEPCGLNLVVAKATDEKQLIIK